MRNRYSVTIPTVLPQRRDSLLELLDQLRGLCPLVPTVVSPHVDGAPRGRDFLEALRLGAALDCDWTLHLEDDAYLAPDFADVALSRLAEADRKGIPVVSFYSDNRRVLAAMAEGRTSCELPARYLWATVCIAVRSREVSAITAFAPSWYADHPEHWHASDLLLRSFYASAGATVLLAVPSAVQHRDLPTTLGHRTRRARFSRSFLAVYGPVPELCRRQTGHLAVNQDTSRGTPDGGRHV
jgi:hypothetical protein